MASSTTGEFRITPEGGTVDWTNPWGQHKYVDDIEAREDGGTPAFLQTIKTALCIRLKEEMGVDNILAREHELLDLIWDKLSAVPNIHILAGNHRDRMPVISFYIDDMHYNLGVRLLNDKFGIQSRGGCSCAGTYGHYLLHVNPEQSAEITDRINHGDYSTKPGWIRISLHPTLTNEEVRYIGDSIVELAVHHQEWGANYEVNYACGGAPTIESATDAELKQRMDLVFSMPLVQEESAIME
jgi:selenocysteine lyase/cysteine desulfurase